MPIYPLRCNNCGDVETFATMSEARAKDLLDCPVCERPRPRRVVLPQYQEDRTRFFKGALGTGYSHALGELMPDSRSARDRLAKKKGVEFVTLSEHLAENKEAKEAVEYAAHVKAGGDRVLDRPAPATDAFVQKPAWAKGLGV